MAAKPASPAKRPNRKRGRGILKIASLGIAGLIAGLLSGCNVSTESPALTSYSRVAGNWQFGSGAPAAAALPALSGSLSVNGSQVTGTLHPLTGVTVIDPTANARPGWSRTAKSSCSPTSSFPVTGNVGLDGKTTLNSSNFPGGNLTITGTLAPNQSSLTNATYGVTGGACAFSTTPVIAAEYTPVTGTYTGTIYSVTGDSLFVSTIFTQTTQPDANGTYHLQGNSTFGSLQPCLPTPPSVSDSTVTGSSLNATYTESSSGTLITVVVDATFTPDASSLTLNSYHITGGYCDGDSGHGTLTRQ